MDANQQPALEAGAKKTVFASVPTFSGVIAKNPDFHQWAPEDKNSLADMFFNEKFGDLEPDDQQVARVEFNKKYDVGHVPLNYNVADDPVSQIGVPLQRFGDLATLGLPARAWDAAKMGEGNTADTRDAQLSDYATDPGIYGDLYRTSQNSMVKGLGGLAGMLHGTNSIVGPVEQSGLGALTSAYGAGNKLLRPFLGTAEKAAFSVGATGWNALNHGMAALRGDETPGQALASLGIDTAMLPIGGKTRLGNAAAQAGAGGASSVLSNLIHGQKVDWNEALQQAITQAGVGAAFHGSPKQKQNKPIEGRVEHTENKPVTQAPPVDRKQQAIEIHNMLTSGDPRVRVQGKALHEQIKAAARDKRSSTNPNRIRRAGDPGAKEILAHLEIIRQQQKGQKPAKRAITSKQQYEDLAQKTLKYRAKGGKITAAFENYLDRNFSKEDKRIINARVKELKGEVKAETTKEQERADIRRETGKTKAKGINQTRQEAARKSKESENGLIKAEKAKQKAEEDEAKKQAAREESGHLILGAVKSATARPAEKTGTATERTAPGADRYKKMAQEAKTEPKPEAQSAESSKPKSGAAANEVHDILKAAVKATERPAGTAEEYRSSGPDEYKRMAKEAKAEPKTASTQKEKQAPVLDNADIEARSNELVEHRKNNEKGQLEAKLSEHRKAAKGNHTKTGATPERSEAINKSHQRVLDAYAQKSAELGKKPSASEMKAGQEANRVELSKLNDQGGKYTPGDKTATQRPARGLTLEALKGTAEWDNLDPASKAKAEEWAKAAKADGEAIIEYDAEISGDTGQFKLKTVSPLGLDVGGTIEHPTLIGHATNRDGHHATYYLSPSAANKKTGFSSFTHDITPLPETNGNAKRGLDANVYHGQREVPVSSVMERPVRKTAGYTSETEAMMAGAHGQNVHGVRKAVSRQAKKKGQPKAAGAAKTIEGMAKQSRLVDNVVVKQPSGEVKTEDFNNLSDQSSKLKKPKRNEVADKTGC